MNSDCLDSNQNSSEVTVVVSRKIKHGHEKEYDDWLRRILALERKFHGYLGTIVIMDSGADSAVRHIIFKYSNKASLYEWENSEERNKLIEEGKNYSTPYLQKATGLETWFTLPNTKAIVAPPRWKMAIVAFIGAYCISSISRFVLGSFLGQWPLIINLLVTIALVIGLTYFAMPLLSRLLRRWLYPNNIWHLQHQQTDI
jgi:antibiotic biosynthesis monooxygenase (ABM) superfamily enzyme